MLSAAEVRMGGVQKSGMIFRLIKGLRILVFLAFFCWG